MGVSRPYSENNHDDITPEEIANLVARFGEAGKDVILDAAYRQAKRIHQMNRELAEEMREAGIEFEDLGDAYAHAQLWNPSAIRGNEAEARRFFLEVFGGKPTDEFLDEWGMTQAQFQKLGVEDVTVNGTKLAPEEGLTQRSRYLKSGRLVTNVPKKVCDGDGSQTRRDGR